MTDRAQRQEKVVAQVRHQVARKTQRRRWAFRALQMNSGVINAAFLGGHSQQLLDQQFVTGGDIIPQTRANHLLDAFAKHGLCRAGSKHNVSGLVDLDQDVSPAEGKGDEFFASSRHVCMWSRFA